MAELGDICGELKRELAQLQAECWSMSTRISGFDDFVDSYTRNWIGRKLKIVAGFITAQAESIYKSNAWFYERYGKWGQVFVILKRGEGFILVWNRSASMSITLDFFKTLGRGVCPVEEVTTAITQLTDELDSGSWVNALAWLREYARADGLDFGDYP